MQNRQRMQPLTIPPEPLPEADAEGEKTPTSVSTVSAEQRCPGKAWQIVKRYPISCGAIVLQVETNTSCIRA